jgi:hypothetical protein
MSTATTWTSEYETTGRVVFPQRRSRLLIRGVVGLVLVANSIWTIVDHVRDDDMGGAMGVLRLTALAAFLYLVGLTGWQLITRRPVVTIDRAGITLGSKGRLHWNEISRIGDPSGLPGLRTIQIQPVDRRANANLGIPQDNVLELAELSDWIRALHQQQRAD